MSTSCKLVVQKPDPGFEVEVSWSIGESDASCWRHPLTLTINPNISSPDWETVLFMSREEVRLLRDYLTTLLASPDLRQCERGGEIKLHD